ncbi:glycosyltransferase family 2 protein [Rhodocyclus tenuis]|uniref:Glycosyltransferase involved in cell wall biosynthesis n=1 Tax=Rhodocyclus tenuis TaxID=1066 RepID=A0A840G6P7_RHOTE|nr:glycosyltransferase family 2 protein [Rhodocyclus tenuis]MBB4246630.1 glycosyltransferase involved in cell wall biosynthesis [Rhodocyclus tenuis]
MPKISVCILTFNSLRTLERCLQPAREVADELIVVDSGSTDGTLEYLSTQGLAPVYRPYDTHSRQMNFAIELASNDWVLCLDSDEFLDPATVERINELKKRLDDVGQAYRITRHWYVLGREVRAIYPVSSPDNPVRLFNRISARFNDQPVDDKPTGFTTTETIPGHVVHDTFFSLNEVFDKVNGYTSRLVRHKTISPSLLRAAISPIFAFLKWYFRKGGYKDGALGIITATYAALYTFLKYLKAWAIQNGLPIDSPRKQDGQEI